MTRLPPKRVRPRSGIERAPKRVFPRHRRFVKQHGCSVPGCLCQDIDFAHVKTRGAGGADWFGISLCRAHHTEQHNLGVDTFGAKYGIDLWALAAEFTKRSPDTAMKEAMKEMADAL